MGKQEGLKIITYDQFKSLVDSMTLDEFIRLADEEFEINIPEKNQISKLSALDYVYDVYLSLLEEYKINLSKVRVSNDGGRKKVKSVKSFIENTIIEAKEIDKTELIKAVKEEFPEKYQDKSPKNRIRNTLKSLKLQDLVEEENNIIKYIGE